MHLSSYNQFQARRFDRKVQEAIQVAKKILDDTRNPIVAGDVDHKYDGEAQKIVALSCLNSVSPHCITQPACLSHWTFFGIVR